MLELIKLKINIIKIYDWKVCFYFTAPVKEVEICMIIVLPPN